MAQDPSAESPPPQPPVYFQTGNTNFAAALIVCGLLKYVRPLKLARVTVFVFEDPEQQGLELERRFVRDVFPHCSPRSFSQARAFLVGEINRLAGKAEVEREPR